MCLAIPMRINEINGNVAHCEAAGVFREVNLMLIEDQTIAIGDFVLVHTGYAIQKVSSHDANHCWEAYDAMQVAHDIARHRDDTQLNKKIYDNGGNHA